ncbi:heme exporter protein CcmD [Ectothiorhodospiraceae bacterium BW-2]|nr:heme exporter protein CcmD [Ectothiorhodospiraceae bacterium BW-2]
MGGYWLYVWGSFVVTALFMVAEPVILYRRQRHIEGALRRQQRQEKALVDGGLDESTT